MNRTLLCVSVACLLLASALAAPAANIIRVRWDSPADGPGTDWDNAFRTVTAAIAASVAGDEIWVAGKSAHPYYERVILKNGVSLYGGFAGTESARDQRDWAANPTILNGSGAGTVVRSQTGATASTVVDGFTLTNAGGATTNAGVMCPSSSPRIANCILTNSGTGVHCQSSASPEIIDNTISGHSTGISCTYSSSPVVTGNTILNNGTGLHADTSAPKITKNTFSRNGAAIYYNYQCSSPITNNVIAGNDWHGIYCGYFSSPVIASNTISGNKGAGINCFKFSSPTITNNVVAFNQTGVSTSSDGTPVLKNNCVHTPGGLDYEGLSAGPGDINDDPQFVDRPSGNLHLLASSPCIDAGLDSAVPAWLLTDMAGAPRILGPHVDMGAYESMAGSIWEARGSKDGALVALSGAIVTASWPDVLYVEQNDRACGVRVHKAGHGLAVGQTASASGVMATDADGERFLQAATASGSPGTPLAAMEVTTRALGGAATPDYSAEQGTGQRGVIGSAGVNNIGLLVRLAGRVEFIEPGGAYFVLSDGSGIQDPVARPGVRVRAAGIMPPGLAEGNFVTVAGISSCYRSGEDLYPQLLARTAADIKIVSP